MAGKEWVIIQVPYGGGYSSLNLAKPRNVKKAPKALKKEFMRQRIFMADNGVSSWDNVAWQEVSLGFGRQNNADGWTNMLNIIGNTDWKSDTNILFLGGSHSITASTYLSMITKFGYRRTGLIVLDAHPDCCYKANWPIHSDWLSWLVKYCYIPPENILIIGLRQIERAEKEFLDEFNIKYYCIGDVRDAESFVMNDISIMRALEKLRKLAAMYISIDIDVTSAAYAPGTGCPSPGGFTDIELINLVKQLKATLPNLRAADIVEINPLNWWRKKIMHYDVTVDLGVKLIKEIIS